MLAGCAYAILADDHLKNNVFFNKLSQSKQATLNVFFALFLIIPTAFIIFGLSWSFVLNEWRAQDMTLSLQAITAPSFLKNVSLTIYIILVFAFTQLTALAALSLSCKSILMLCENTPLASRTKSEEEGR